MSKGPRVGRSPEAKHIESNSECWLPSWVCGLGLLCRCNTSSGGSLLSFPSPVLLPDSMLQLVMLKHLGSGRPCIVHHFVPRYSMVPGTRVALRQYVRISDHISASPCSLAPRALCVPSHTPDAAGLDITLPPTPYF